MFHGYWCGGLEHIRQNTKLVKHALSARPEDQSCALEGLGFVVFLQDDMVDLGQLERVGQRQAYDASADDNDPERLRRCCISLRHAAFVLVRWWVLLACLCMLDVLRVIGEEQWRGTLTACSKVARQRVSVSRLRSGYCGGES